jgi:predicted nucleotidyltransferase
MDPADAPGAGRASDDRPEEGDWCRSGPAQEDNSSQTGPPPELGSSDAADEAFLARLAGRLARLSRVCGVALGGSRATGGHRPASDWDLAVYYRGGFDVDEVRRLGYPGTISELGGWGGGVFNGGAWLQVEGRRVDLHYRDLDEVEHQLAESRAGRFAIEPLLFHSAGIPTYLVVAELAVNRVLHGQLPQPVYPAALRRAAPQVWWGRARALLEYARKGHAPYGRVGQCLAQLTEATLCAAHAVAADHGQWVTNEKTLLSSTRLSDLDAMVVASLRKGGQVDLSGLCDEVDGWLSERLAEVVPPMA